MHDKTRQDTQRDSRRRGMCIVSPSISVMFVHLLRNKNVTNTRAIFTRHILRQMKFYGGRVLCERSRPMQMIVVEVAYDGLGTQALLGHSRQRRQQCRRHLCAMQNLK